MRTRNDDLHDYAELDNAFIRYFVLVVSQLMLIKKVVGFLKSMKDYLKTPDYQIRRDKLKQYDKIQEIMKVKKDLLLLVGINNQKLIVELGIDEVPEKYLSHGSKKIISGTPVRERGLLNWYEFDDLISMLSKKMRCDKADIYQKLATGDLQFEENLALRNEIEDFLKRILKPDTYKWFRWEKRFCYAALIQSMEENANAGLYQANTQLDISAPRRKIEFRQTKKRISFVDEMGKGDLPRYKEGKREVSLRNGK